MAKKDFTQSDREKYRGIIAAANEDQKTRETNAKKGKRPYSRLDPREPAPEEYRFTVRMPGECGRFIAELAYQERSTITAEFTRLVTEEMERRPDILEKLDELNFKK